MQEIFLQYIWQHQLFDKSELQTTDGKAIEIIRPGYWNDESGPDFLQAQIKLDGLTWFGAVEIHIDARDWQRHHHQLDAAYDNVILHVAWHREVEMRRKDGTPIPLVLLEHRVAPPLIHQYSRLLSHAKNKKAPACANSVATVPSIYKASALERAAASRLMRKSEEISGMYRQNGNDWYQTAWQCLFQAFGFKVNALPFAALGAKIPYRCLYKEHKQFEAVLAILLGVSGHIEEGSTNPKLHALAKHLMRKYGLNAKAMNKHEYRRAPIRPANTPRVRIIQLAAVLCTLPHHFTFLIAQSDVEEYLRVFDKANQCMRQHAAVIGKISRLGKGSMESILINAVAPFQYAYARHASDEALEEQARLLWQSIAPEKNRYSRQFQSLGFEMPSAMESQGAIELQRFSCSQGRCLQCPVGNYIMKNHQLVVI